MKRREFITSSLSATALLGFAGSSVATGSPHFSRRNRPPSDQIKSADELVTPETRRAIDRGLEYLANRQITGGQSAGSFGSGGYAGGVAISSLAGLAFMCNGSTPIGGRYRRQINRCTKFVLKNTRPSGYIVKEGHAKSNMYGHGYGMLYLSQALGMSQSSEIMEKLRLSVDMTCRVQNNNGGWRYQPTKQPGDLSVTICQIMALRAAHDAGLQVSEEVRSKTVDYVRKSQNSDGSFKYMLRGGRTSVALTAAGVVSLYSAGIYEDDGVHKALSWLMRHLPGNGAGRTVSPMNHFYAHYYGVQAMWHAQFQQPEYWNQWYPAIRDELLNQRLDKRTWNDKVGPEFATAMACIILQIPFNYVPVFAP